MELQDFSVSTTRAFDNEGETTIVYWELRNSAMGEQVVDAIWDGDSFVHPLHADQVVTDEDVSSMAMDKAAGVELADQLGLLLRTMDLVVHSEVED